MADTVWKNTLKFMLLMRTISVSSSFEDCCEIQETKLTCVGCIPRMIPQNVSAVSIHRVNFADYASEPPFNTTHWSHVTHLTVLPDDMFQDSEYSEFPSFALYSKSFYHIRELRVLTFTSSRLSYMRNAVFDGLKNIRDIYLTDCGNIGIKSVTSGLTGSHLPELRTLSLRGVYRLSSSAGFFDGRFFDFLKTTKIQILDLSDTENKFMDVQSFSNSMPYLHTLNLENGGYLIANFVAALHGKANKPTLNNLKHINVNYPTIHEAVYSIANSFDLQSSKFTSLVNFTDIRMRRCAPVAYGYMSHMLGVIDSTNTSILFTAEFIKKDFNFQIAIRLVTDHRAQSFLETLDLGENGIGSFDFNFANALGRLKHLNVSQNMLYKINARDYEKVLWQMHLLESLNCSYNKLVLIPKQMFRFCFKLKSIDISNNRLEHLDFDVSHLTGLRLLDASYNRIHTLGDVTLDIFSSMIDSSNVFNLVITDNPFECSCSNKDFIAWLIKNKSRMNTNYTCSVDGNKNDQIFVDLRAIRTIDHLCILPIIYITASISSAVLLTALIIVTVCCVRRYKRKQAWLKKQKKIEMFRLNKTKERIPVFLSYCSSDDGLVGAHILPMLNTKLQTLLQTDKQCVCTGDTTFAVGFYTANEVIECIESSCIILACVSNKYCESRFCKDEIMTAYQERKPIILLFLEIVDVKQLPKAIQKHFYTITRAKVQVESGQELIFTPDIDAICESIVKLMQPTDNDA